jgi:Tol biopolymer transport system component
MLAAGSPFGAYTIVEKLGEGGMGQVYRARDSRLDRDVAIKILPESFALDPDRVARFTREAKTLAALNDPHIAGLYGIEEHGGVRALVMELVEGEELSQVIARGPLPLADALPIVRQIAEALEVAHEQGIIHRDLKPANIKVKPDGTVKVLDFGLAKATGAEGAAANASNSPTLTARATAIGMIIGTAAYMAPEQAKGRVVDRRADIWAFGAIFFEMLTGRRAFIGDDISETLAAVLRDTPPMASLPASTPRPIRELIARCLQKDPRGRQRDIGDVRLELATAPSSDAAAPVIVDQRRASPILMLGVLAAGVAMGLTALWWWRGSPQTSAAEVTRFMVTANGPGDQRWPALTPDGRTLIFGAGGKLYRRSLDSFETTAIPGTDNALVPMVSPDGKSLAFFADHKIKRVSFSGGDPVAFADADSNMPGACWCTDGEILFSRSWSTGFFAASLAGGEVRQITTPDTAKGERGHWRPQPLPGGKRVLFTIMMAGTGVNDSKLAILDRDSGKYRTLFPGTDGRYLASGHILFFHGGAWHVVPFDAAAERATGDPVTVLGDAYGVQPDGGGAGDIVSASATGVLAYLPGPTFRRNELVWVDRTGAVQPTGLPPRVMNLAALSPDGKRVAVTRVEGGAYQVWVVDLVRKTEDRVDIKGGNLQPIWNPDGEWLGLVSERRGVYATYIVRPDGSGERALLDKDYDQQAKAWTHDGKRIIAKQWLPDGTTPIVLVDAASGATSQVLLTNATPGMEVQVSPDDRWFLYSLGASQAEVFVRALAPNAPAVRVSTAGGRAPMWSVDGSEIYFHHGDDMMAASFRVTGGRPEIGLARRIFGLPQNVELVGLDHDGKRFLVFRPVDPEPAPGVRVVLNWFSTLNR